MRPHPAIALLLLMLAGCGVVPDSKTADRGVRQAGSPAISTARPEARQCHAELGMTGSRFIPLPDKFYGQACSTANSVRLEGVGGDRGEFTVTNLGAVACPLANNFAGLGALWRRPRGARQILGSPLQKIETMGSYSCRNVAGTARRSAHSRAEAIDVSAFVLADGRRVSVLSGWNASREEREFLRVIHKSACKRAGTVLGPDYNRAHHDHFHLEYGKGSYCR